MPLLLLPEEVVFLLEQGTESPVKRSHFASHPSPELAHLVDDIGSHVCPTPHQLSTWNDTRKARLDASDRADRVTKATPPRLSDAALQKRLERQKRKEAQIETWDSHALTAPESDLREASGAKETASYGFRIPATSEVFPWYEEKTYHTLQAASDAGLWTYPSNQEERAKCAVFADLWKKGYYMGNGFRFGGDWLVYPGTCPVSVFGNYSSSPRRPAPVPLPFCGHCLSVSPYSNLSNGDRCAWASWHCDEEIPSGLQLGRIHKPGGLHLS